MEEKFETSAEFQTVDINDLKSKFDTSVTGETKNVLATMQYSTEIDYDYLDKIEGNLDALYEYIADNFIEKNYNVSREATIKYCKAMMQVCNLLGFIPSYDQFIFVMADYRFTYNQAVAGAGKTTFSQLRAIKEKLFNKLTGMEILCVAYNESAKKDMEKRHAELVEIYNNYYWPKFRAKFQEKLISGEMKESELKAKVLLDPTLETYTFHSLALSWVSEYIGDPQFPQIKVFGENFILEDDAIKAIMTGAFETWLEDHPTLMAKMTDKQTSSCIKNLASIYDWHIEYMDFEMVNVIDTQYYKEISEFVPNIEDILLIFNYYRRLCNNRRKAGFSDILRLFHELLQHQDVLDRIRKLHKYIIFDEYQDSSNLMTECLRLIVNGNSAKGLTADPAMKVTVIGDVDQCLYTFRGVSVENSLLFREKFGKEDTVTVSMATNRRCLAPIVKFSAAVIKNNKMRIVKPVLPTRGDRPSYVDENEKYDAIEFKGYEYEHEYISEIIQYLRTMPKERLADSAIIYRNRSSSIAIAMEMFNNKIPFKVIKGIEPYKDMLTKTISDAMNLCYKPTDIRYARRVLSRVLYRTKGLTNSAIQQAITNEEKAYEANKDASLKPFWEYNYGSVGDNPKFQLRLEKLKELSKDIRGGKPVKVMAKEIFALLDINVMKFSPNMPAEHLFPILMENYESDAHFGDFRQDVTAKLKAHEERSKYNSIELTTFHSTKGLEYDTVFQIDLDDSIFPGVEIEECNNNAELVDKAMESCRRLFYVAVTRAKNKLVLYINRHNPCRLLAEANATFKSEDLDKILNGAEELAISTGLTARESLGVKSDGVTGVQADVSDAYYVNSLPVIKVDCDRFSCIGYFDGFMHVGDYVARNQQEQKLETVESKVTKLFKEYGLSVDIEQSYVDTPEPTVLKVTEDGSLDLFGDSDE